MGTLHTDNITGAATSNPTTVANAASIPGAGSLPTAKGIFVTSSVVLQFQNPRQAPSATETEQVGIAICPAEEIVPDDFGGNEAEGDAIATVAQRKIGVRKPGMDANVS